MSSANDPSTKISSYFGLRSCAGCTRDHQGVDFNPGYGTAAIVEFPGVLYRGGAEQKIRKYLIDNNYYEPEVLARYDF